MMAVILTGGVTAERYSVLLYMQQGIMGGDEVICVVVCV